MLARRGDHFDIVDGEVCSSSSDGAASPGTKDNSSVYIVALTKRLMQEGKIKESKTIYITKSSKSASLSEIFRVSDGSDLMNCGGSATMSIAREVAEALFGVSGVYEVQESTLETSPASIEHGSAGKAQLIRTVEILGKSVSKEETTLNSDGIERSDRASGYARVHRQGQITDMLRIMVADKQGKFRNFTEQHMREARESGETIFELADGKKITLYIVDPVRAKGQSGADRADTIARNMGRGDTILISTDFCGRGLDFGSKVRSRDFNTSDNIVQVIVDGDLMGGGRLMQTLGRTGRGLDLSFTKRYVLVDKNRYTGRIAEISRLAGLKQYQGLKSMGDIGNIYNTLVESTREIGELETSIEPTSQQIVDILMSTAAGQKVLMQELARFNDIVDKSEATLFKAGTELETRLLKRSLAQWAGRYSEDAQMSEAIEDYARLVREQGHREDADLVMKLSSYRSPESIIQNRYIQALKNARKVLEQMAGDKRLTPDIRRDANAKLREIIEFEMTGYDFEALGEVSLKDVNFSNTPDFGSVLHLARVIKALSQFVVPTRFSSEVDFMAQMQVSQRTSALKKSLTEITGREAGKEGGVREADITELSEFESSVSSPDGGVNRAMLIKALSVAYNAVDEEETGRRDMIRNLIDAVRNADTQADIALAVQQNAGALTTDAVVILQLGNTEFSAPNLDALNTTGPADLTPGALANQATAEYEQYGVSPDFIRDAVAIAVKQGMIRTDTMAQAEADIKQMFGYLKDAQLLGVDFSNMDARTYVNWARQGKTFMRSAMEDIAAIQIRSRGARTPVESEIVARADERKHKREQEQAQVSAGIRKLKAEQAIDRRMNKYDVNVGERGVDTGKLVHRLQRLAYGYGSKIADYAGFIGTGAVIKLKSVWPSFKQFWRSKFGLDQSGRIRSALLEENQIGIVDQTAEAGLRGAYRSLQVAAGVLDAVTGFVGKVAGSDSFKKMLPMLMPAVVTLPLMFAFGFGSPIVIAAGVATGLIFNAGKIVDKLPGKMKIPNVLEMISSTKAVTVIKEALKKVKAQPAKARDRVQGMQTEQLLGRLGSIEDAETRQRVMNRIMAYEEYFGYGVNRAKKQRQIDFMRMAMAQGVRAFGDLDTFVKSLEKSPEEAIYSLRDNSRPGSDVHTAAVRLIEVYETNDELTYEDLEGMDSNIIRLVMGDNFIPGVYAGDMLLSEVSAIAKALYELSDTETVDTPELFNIAAKNGDTPEAKDRVLARMLSQELRANVSVEQARRMRNVYGSIRINDPVAAATISLKDLDKENADYAAFMRGCRTVIASGVAQSTGSSSATLESILPAAVDSIFGDGTTAVGLFRALHGNASNRQLLRNRMVQIAHMMIPGADEEKINEFVNTLYNALTAGITNDRDFTIRVLPSLELAENASVAEFMIALIENDEFSMFDAETLQSQISSVQPRGEEEIRNERRQAQLDIRVKRLNKQIEEAKNARASLADRYALIEALEEKLSLTDADDEEAHKKAYEGLQKARKAFIDVAEASDEHYVAVLLAYVQAKQEVGEEVEDDIMSQIELIYQGQREEIALDTVVIGQVSVSVPDRIAVVRVFIKGLQAKAEKEDISTEDEEKLQRKIRQGLKLLGSLINELEGRPEKQAEILMEIIRALMLMGDYDNAREYIAQLQAMEGLSERTEQQIRCLQDEIEHFKDISELSQPNPEKKLTKEAEAAVDDIFQQLRGKSAGDRLVILREARILYPDSVTLAVQYELALLEVQAQEAQANQHTFTAEERKQRFQMLLRVYALQPFNQFTARMINAEVEQMRLEDLDMLLALWQENKLTPEKHIWVRRLSEKMDALVAEQISAIETEQDTTVAETEDVLITFMKKVQSKFVSTSASDRRRSLENNLRGELNTLLNSKNTNITAARMARICQVVQALDKLGVELTSFQKHYITLMVTDKDFVSALKQDVAQKMRGLEVSDEDRRAQIVQLNEAINLVRKFWKVVTPRWYSVTKAQKEADDKTVTANARVRNNVVRGIRKVITAQEEIIRAPRGMKLSPEKRRELREIVIGLSTKIQDARTVMGRLLVDEETEIGKIKLLIDLYDNAQNQNVKNELLQRIVNHIAGLELTTENAVTVIEFLAGLCSSRADNMFDQAVQEKVNAAARAVTFNEETAVNELTQLTSVYNKFEEDDPVDDVLRTYIADAVNKLIKHAGMVESLSAREQLLGSIQDISGIDNIVNLEGVSMRVLLISLKVQTQDELSANHRQAQGAYFNALRDGTPEEKDVALADQITERLSGFDAQTASAEMIADAVAYLEWVAETYSADIRQASVLAIAQQLRRLANSANASNADRVRSIALIKKLSEQEVVAKLKGSDYSFWMLVRDCAQSIYDSIQQREEHAGALKDISALSKKIQETAGNRVKTAEEKEQAEAAKRARAIAEQYAVQAQQDIIDSVRESELTDDSALEDLSGACEALRALRDKGDEFRSQDAVTTALEEAYKLQRMIYNTRLTTEEGDDVKSRLAFGQALQKQGEYPSAAVQYAAVIVVQEDTSKPESQEAYDGKEGGLVQILREIDDVGVAEFVIEMIGEYSPLYEMESQKGSILSAIMGNRNFNEENIAQIKQALDAMIDLKSAILGDNRFETYKIEDDEERAVALQRCDRDGGIFDRFVVTVKLADKDREQRVELAKALGVGNIAEAAKILPDIQEDMTIFEKMALYIFLANLLQERGDRPEYRIRLLTQALQFAREIGRTQEDNYELQIELEQRIIRDVVAGVQQRRTELGKEQGSVTGSYCIAFCNEFGLGDTAIMLISCGLASSDEDIAKMDDTVLRNMLIRRMAESVVLDTEYDGELSYSQRVDGKEARLRLLIANYKRAHGEETPAAERIAIGDLYRRGGNAERAKEQYELAIKADEAQSARAYYGLALLAEAEEDDDAYVDNLKKAVEKDANMIDVLVRLLAWDEGKAAKAETKGERKALEKTAAEYREKLFNAYMNSGKLDEAAKLLPAIKKADKKQAGTLQKQLKEKRNAAEVADAEKMLEDEKFMEAVEAWRKILAHKKLSKEDRVKYRLQLIKSLYGVGNYEQVTAVCDKVLKTDEENKEALMYKARVLAQRIKASEIGQAEVLVLRDRLLALAEKLQSADITDKDLLIQLMLARRDNALKTLSSEVTPEQREAERYERGKVPVGSILAPKKTPAQFQAEVDEVFSSEVDPAIAACDAILAQDPNNTDALDIRHKLLIAKRDYAVRILGRHTGNKKHAAEVKKADTEAERARLVSVSIHELEDMTDAQIQNRVGVIRNGKLEGEVQDELRALLRRVSPENTELRLEILAMINDVTFMDLALVQHRLSEDKLFGDERKPVVVENEQEDGSVVTIVDARIMKVMQALAKSPQSNSEYELDLLYVTLINLRAEALENNIADSDEGREQMVQIDTMVLSVISAIEQKSSAVTSPEMVRVYVQVMTDGYAVTTDQKVTDVEEEIAFRQRRGVSDMDTSRAAVATFKEERAMTQEADQLVKEAQQLYNQVKQELSRLRGRRTVSTDRQAALMDKLSKINEKLQQASLLRANDPVITKLRAETVLLEAEAAAKNVGLWRQKIQEAVSELERLIEIAQAKNDNELLQEAAVMLLKTARRTNMAVQRREALELLVPMMLDGRMSSANFVAYAYELAYVGNNEYRRLADSVCESAEHIQVLITEGAIAEAMAEITSVCSRNDRITPELLFSYRGSSISRHSPGGGIVRVVVDDTMDLKDFTYNLPGMTIAVFRSTSMPQNIKFGQHKKGSHLLHGVPNRVRQHVSMQAFMQTLRKKADDAVNEGNYAEAIALIERYQQMMGIENAQDIEDTALLAVLCIALTKEPMALDVLRLQRVIALYEHLIGREDLSAKDKAALYFARAYMARSRWDTETQDHEMYIRLGMEIEDGKYATADVLSRVLELDEKTGTGSYFYEVRIPLQERICRENPEDMDAQKGLYRLYKESGADAEKLMKQARTIMDLYLKLMLNETDAGERRNYAISVLEWYGRLDNQSKHQLPQDVKYAVLEAQKTVSPSFMNKVVTSAREILIRRGLNADAIFQRAVRLKDVAKLQELLEDKYQTQKTARALAKIYEEQGEYAKAIAVLTNAVLTNKEYSKKHNVNDVEWLAALYEESGQMDKAVEQYVRLAQSYKKQKSYDRMVAVLIQAVESDPGNTKALDMLRWFHRQISADRYEVLRYDTRHPLFAQLRHAGFQYVESAVDLGLEDETEEEEDTDEPEEPQSPSHREKRGFVKWFMASRSSRTVAVILTLLSALVLTSCGTVSSVDLSNPAIWGNLSSDVQRAEDWTGLPLPMVRETPEATTVPIAGKVAAMVAKDVVLDAGVDPRYAGLTETDSGRTIAKIRDTGLSASTRYRTAVHESVHVWMAESGVKEQLKKKILACAEVHTKFFPALIAAGYDQRHDLWEEVAAYYLENLGTSDPYGTAVAINELRISVKLDKEIIDLMAEYGFLEIAKVISKDNRFRFSGSMGTRDAETGLALLELAPARDFSEEKANKLHDVAGKVKASVVTGNPIVVVDQDVIEVIGVTLFTMLKRAYREVGIAVLSRAEFDRLLEVDQTTGTGQGIINDLVPVGRALGTSALRSSADLPPQMFTLINKITYVEMIAAAREVAAYRGDYESDVNARIEEMKAVSKKTRYILLHNYEERSSDELKAYIREIRARFSAQEDGIIQFIDSTEEIQEEQHELVIVFDPEDRDDIERRNDALYLPLPYIRATLYVALELALTGREDEAGLESIVRSRPVGLFIQTLYKQLRGSEIDPDDLKDIFRNPWEILPEVGTLAGRIDDIRTGLFEVETSC